jgi:hypothetical protein
MAHRFGVQAHGNQESNYNTYVRHYQSQFGGNALIPSFRGTPYQTGEGLGDILRAFSRVLLPILGPIASSFASRFIKSTSAGLESGKSLKDSAKSSLGPAVSDGLSSAGDQIMSRISKAQSGSGRRRRRKGNAKNVRRRRTAHKAAPHAMIGAGKRRRVYKGRRKSPKRTSRKPRKNNLFASNF